METIELVKDDKSVKQTFIALAHRIKLNEANWKKKYLVNLVETAFFHKDNYHFDSKIDIQEFIRCEEITCFKIYEHELKDAINELVGKKILLETPIGWKLAENRKTELEKITNEWLNLEQKVKEDWLNSIGLKYPRIRESEKNQLWTQLIEKFVVKIFMRHGAETSKLVFGHSIPGEDKFLESLQKILEDTIRDLPKYLEEIAKNEYLIFFDPNNSDRRQYLMGLLDSCFSHFAMDLTEESLQTIYSTTNCELELFLDTNFLFSAIGLGEHHLNESVREVLKLQQTISKILDGKVKIKFYYTTETLDEFKKAINSSISRLNGAQVNKSIAKAVVKSGRLSGLDLAYFKKLAQSNVTIGPKDYYRPYCNGAERLLKREGIEIYNSKEISLDSIRNAQGVIDDTHDFNAYLKERDKVREWETIEHDVRLWHFVKRLRECLSITPLSAIQLEAKFFILTLDYRFLGFDRHKIRLRNESPICLLPPQFLQILSLFIPRTEDFEKAFISSIKTPIARLIDAETEGISLNILKAIAVYKDFSEDIAVELLIDEALNVEIKDISDPEEVRRLIEDKLSKKLSEERRKSSNLQNEIEAELSEKEILKRVNKQSEAKIQKLEKLIEDIQKFKSQAEKKEVKRLRNKKIVSSIFKWTICISLWIILGALALKFWTDIPRILQIALGFSVVWPLSLPIGLKKTWKIFLAISSFLSGIRVIAWALGIG